MKLLSQILVVLLWVSHLGAAKKDRTSSEDSTESEPESAGTSPYGNVQYGNKKGHTCSITKGGSLVSFLKARTVVELPCRYVVGEFFCDANTRVTAQNSIARDKRPFVSSVTIQKAVAPQSDEYDEISLSVDSLGKIFGLVNETDPRDTKWEHVADEVYVSENRRWLLLVDEDQMEGMITDTESNHLQIYLSYLNATHDMSKAGGLTIVCSDPNFDTVPGSDGYLCGKVGDNGDDQHHLKDRALAVGLKVPDYITYHILVQQDVKQRKSLCQLTDNSTTTCAYPIEAVERCAQFLHRSTYVYKCFDNRRVSPLEAFSACVRLRCRKDWPSCQALAEVLGDCPRYLKYKRNLPCERVRLESEE